MKAVYAGSFDCYTNGHHDIVRKASRLFDEVHIVIAVNSSKKRSYPAEQMAEAIRAALEREGLSNCKVSISTELSPSIAVRMRSTTLFADFATTSITTTRKTWPM